MRDHEWKLIKDYINCKIEYEFARREDFEESQEKNKAKIEREWLEIAEKDVDEWFNELDKV